MTPPFPPKPGGSRGLGAIMDHLGKKRDEAQALSAKGRK